MAKIDGNLAFKCIWNDSDYCNICSKDNYIINTSKKKHQNCFYCHDYQNQVKEFNQESFPCYESQLFVNFGIGSAGSKIRNAKENKIALLTTRMPCDKEIDRFIFGYFIISEIIHDDQYDTYIQGDPNNCIIIDKNIMKEMKFWNYFRNPHNPNSISWNMGLYRYPKDSEIYSFLCDLKSKYEKLPNNEEKLSIIERHIEDYKTYV